MSYQVKPTGDDAVDRNLRDIAAALAAPAAAAGTAVTQVKGKPGGTNYQATATDRNLTADATLGPVRIALPAAGPAQEIRVVSVSSAKNDVTVIRSDGKAIGADKLVTVDPFTAKAFLGDGSNWWLISG